MRKTMLKLSLAVALASALPVTPAVAWGVQAHKVVDRAAIAALPVDGPVFLKKYIDHVGQSASMPDTWRSATEPFSKIQEDPNHGWFREQFAFMKNPPRSRYEFVLELYNAHLEQKKTDPDANVLAPFHRPAQRAHVRHQAAIALHRCVGESSGPADVGAGGRLCVGFLLLQMGVV